MISFDCPVDNICALSLCRMEHIHINMSMLLSWLVLSVLDGTYTHSYVNAVIVDWFILKKYLLFPFNYSNLLSFIHILIFVLSINWSVYWNVHFYLFLIYDNLIIFMISPSILLLTLDIYFPETNWGHQEVRYQMLTLQMSSPWGYRMSHFLLPSALTK